ncbi:MAG TPA: gluconate 2-dehydrogenase subunit 3 family protein [Bryobacteraceae bacterium]|nr:gluconate 2-dehydrogenase subunit 3 family protein [Bryobacteraceae bacterium]
MDANLPRRDLLKLFGAAAVIGPLQLAAAEPGKPLFFTQDEFALLDTLTEMIIPADSHSPGARAAGVALYIDKTVAEAYVPEEKKSWRKGLAVIDEVSQATSKKPFLKTAEREQVALLTKLSARELEPHSEPEKFFVQLKASTTFAYYSSSIGLHKEMEYKGNTIQQEFSGYEAT